MAVNQLPPKVQLKRVSDNEISQAHDTITNPLNNVLTFLNGLFTQASAMVSGLVTVNSPLKFTQTITAISAVFTGAIKAASATFSGAISAASASITGALSAASASITGALTAATGVFSTSATAPNLTYIVLFGRYTTALTSSTTNATPSPVVDILLPYNVSVAAISAKVFNAAITSGTVNWNLTNVSTAVTTTGPQLSSTINGAFLTYARGSVPIAAGQSIQIVYTTSAGFAGPSGANGYEVGIWVYQ